MGIGMFLLTLCLGINADRLANYITDQFHLPGEIELIDAHDGMELAEVPRGIRIMYEGVFPVWAEEHEPPLRFHIYNGSSRELKCIGYSGMCASPEIRVRGLDATAWVCMNGSSFYTIKPGESAEVMVDPQDFNFLPGKSELVTVGYEFEHPDGSSDLYFAESIVLPAAFRKAVNKHLKEVCDLEAGLY